MPGLLLIAFIVVLNALVIMVMAIWQMLSWRAGFGLLTGNVALIMGICTLWPRYYVGFVTGVIRYGFYRFHVRGLQHLPRSGAAILVCNHVSYMDVPLLIAACPRPLRFWVYYRLFEQRAVADFLRNAGAIAIASKQQDDAHYEAALLAGVDALRQGQLLLIFPEGRLTRDGQLQVFKNGLMKILQVAQAQGLQPPVIPMALRGLWGSYFSWAELAGPMKRPFRRGWLNRVELRIGQPLLAAEAEMHVLRSSVAQLLDAP